MTTRNERQLAREWVLGQPDEFNVDTDLLEATRAEDHPLNPIARWDVAEDEAAQAWRMGLLRSFIAATRTAVPSIAPTDGGTETAKPAVNTITPIHVAMPAYISDRKRGRVSTRTTDGRTMAIEEAAASLDAWVRRYQAFLSLPVLMAARKLAKAVRRRVNVRAA